MCGADEFVLPKLLTGGASFFAQDAFDPTYAWPTSDSARKPPADERAIRDRL